MAGLTTSILTEEGEALERRLAALVAAFYDRVRADPVLGPVFAGAVDDWPAHLATLSAFWSSVMLGSGRYKGNPLGVHLRHAGAIAPAMFERWLGLWRAAARELLAEDEAAAAIAKAERIGESLQLSLFLRLDKGGPAAG